MRKEKPNTYISNGNLIISGEYFVLNGAKAFAVPLKYGQTMNVNSSELHPGIIKWEASELGKIWLNVNFNPENLKIISTNDIEKALRLQKVLKVIQKRKPGLFRKNKSHFISCSIHFNTDWGWGSSSTFISNLANWTGIDPFELNNMVFNGSGYDIAASLSDCPVFYQICENTRKIIPFNFKPEFHNSIYFIYLGKKQDTAESIKMNLKFIKRNKSLIPLITSLTEQIAAGNNLDEFMRLIFEHEQIIAKTLKETRLKEKYFNDFEGEIKSLGAWGGDFAMAVSKLPETDLKHFFKDKGFDTIFRFEEIVKNEFSGTNPGK